MTHKYSIGFNFNLKPLLLYYVCFWIV